MRGLLGGSVVRGLLEGLLWPGRRGGWSFIGAPTLD